MAYSNKNTKSVKKTPRVVKGKSQPVLPPVTSFLDSLEIPNIKSKIIDTTFGKRDDYVEFHLYNNDNKLIYSDYTFEEYELPTPAANKNASDTIRIDPNKIINNLGYSSGTFTIKLNVLKNKIFNTDEPYLSIKEISTDKREIRAVALDVPNSDLDLSVSRFISDIESSVYFKEFSLNFGNDLLIPSINLLLNKDSHKHEVLFKTLNPLPDTISLNSSFKVVEEITDSIILNVDLGTPEIAEDTISLSGPNFTIDVRKNNSVPSDFKTYNDILQYDVTSSYQHLLSKLEEDSIDLNIHYDHIRAISASTEDSDIPYHFENFVHFSSATERLKNFKYKLSLLEGHDTQLGTIGAITGDTTASNAVILNKNNIDNKKTKIIKGFDGYERFLYFTSGSLYTWPKQNESKPYILYSITSSNVKTWLGDERSSFEFYGGQLLSSSLFDRQNEHNLNKLIPQHIKENQDNNLYIGFVDMIGQHFDNIWSYIKAISDINNSDNKFGISKDLVYHQLKSIGIETFDQFENASLTEYMLGEGSGSSNFNVGFTYGATSVSGSVSGSDKLASETLVTASNASTPKGDIAKEIWKRLYHNSPYLLKTKGTERGIRALMSCYGIPSTILNVKEYGGSATTTGPFIDLDLSEQYKTFTYEKSGLALHGSAGTNGYFVKTDWSSSYHTPFDDANTNSIFTTAQQNHKTVEFRIKPIRSTSKYHLFSLSGSFYYSSDTYYPTSDQHLLLDPYTGNDISSSDDSDNYGRLQYYIGGTKTLETQYFPIYDGNFWNIFMQANEGSSNSKIDVNFGAYRANFNKNIHYHVTSSTNEGANNSFIYSWGRESTSGPNYYGSNGAKSAFFGGVPSNAHSSYNSIDGLNYSGSMQEVRLYFGDYLSHNTLKKHALDPYMYSGNTVSSSYESLVLRLPLGSNDKESLETFHPNIDMPPLGYSGTSSMEAQSWEEVIENHYLPTPDTVGISTTSEKVRIDEGSIDENILSPFIKSETSTLDRQPQDFEDLGIFFSPTNEINEDIIYTLGSFRMDDYIGSPLPSAQSSSKYEDLSTLKKIYFQKVKRRYNYWDYVKLIQYMDHTLFKMVEQFVPARANTKTGLLIEPHYLERTKFKRTIPVRSDDQTMVVGSHQTINGELKRVVHSIRSSSAEDFGQKGLDQGVGQNIVGQHDPGSYVIAHNNFDRHMTASINGRRKEVGTNTTIYIYDEYLDPSKKDPNRENNQFGQSPIRPFDSVTGKPTGYKSHESSVILGNTIKGRKSHKYYQYQQYNLVTSSLY